MPAERSRVDGRESRAARQERRVGQTTTALAARPRHLALWESDLVIGASELAIGASELAIGASEVADRPDHVAVTVLAMGDVPAVAVCRAALVLLRRVALGRTNRVDLPRFSSMMKRGVIIESIPRRAPRDVAAVCESGS